MSEYIVFIERGENDSNYGAWALDLPGCVSTSASMEEVRANMQEAIELHLRGMREDGDPIPEPTRDFALIRVA